MRFPKFSDVQYLHISWISVVSGLPGFPNPRKFKLFIDVQLVGFPDLQVFLIFFIFGSSDSDNVRISEVGSKGLGTGPGHEIRPRANRMLTCVGTDLTHSCCFKFGNLNNFVHAAVRFHPWCQNM